MPCPLPLHLAGSRRPARGSLRPAHLSILRYALMSLPASSLVAAFSYMHHFPTCTIFLHAFPRARPCTRRIQFYQSSISALEACAVPVIVAIQAGARPAEHAQGPRSIRLLLSTKLSRTLPAQPNPAFRPHPRIFPAFKSRRRSQSAARASQRPRPGGRLRQGFCIGGGVDIATACDLRFCTASASFSVKEVDVGITADLGTLQRLPRIVGDGATSPPPRPASIPCHAWPFRCAWQFCRCRPPPIRAGGARLAERSGDLSARPSVCPPVSIRPAFCFCSSVCLRPSVVAFGDSSHSWGTGAFL